MPASWPAMEASANRRAQSTSSMSLLAATCRRMGVHVCGPTKNQKRPILVCSAVRTVLVRLPSSRISFTSFVQVGEVSAAGGGFLAEIDSLCFRLAFSDAGQRRRQGGVELRLLVGI